MAWQANSGVTEGGISQAALVGGIDAKGKLTEIVVRSRLVYPDFARSPVPGGPFGFSADRLGRLWLALASHSIRLILYRLDEIRHAQKRRNRIPPEKRQKPRNRQTFPTRRKSHGRLIERPVRVDTDTDRK